MSLNLTHEGYEYQDLLTAFFILQDISNGKNSTFQIDKKVVDSDYFDDLKIFYNDMIEHKQIKYSNQDNNHRLTKSDLSSKGTYNIALDMLFEAWVNNKKCNPKQINTEFRLCLSWVEPMINDDICKVIEYDGNVKKTFKYTKPYKIIVNELWPDNSVPISNWKRFRDKSKNINRDVFIKFCNELIIEINFPKASLDIYNPSELEIEIFDVCKKIGIGKFPNDCLSLETVLLHATHCVKRARSKGEILSSQKVLNELKIQTNYGSIKQVFNMEDSLNIKDLKKYKYFYKLLKKHKKVMLCGEPGSGKSWFVTNLYNYLLANNIKVIKHYCYTGLDDIDNYNRIKKDIFYGNLISELLSQMPELVSKKRTNFAADKIELEHLLSCIYIRKNTFQV